jgi:acyl-CoA synthetase (NDP forming)
MGSTTGAARRGDGRRRLDPDRLGAFFRPRSLALVGATDASRWSQATFENWRAHAGDRPVYLVHPRHRVVHGQAAYPSLSALPEPPDLLFVMVPTDAVLGVLAEAADLGVRHAVVLTAGFAEAGPAGQAREAELVALAEERDLVVLGPNGNGFVHASVGCCPYGLPLPEPLRPGPLGIALQSGGLASVVLAMAQARAIRPSLVVASGNEAVLEVADVLAYLVEDPATTAVALFLESIRSPERFAEAASAALAAGKPVVALHVGRSQAGQAAALAHTGAVAGDAARTRAFLEHLGVVPVDSLEDLLATAGLLAALQRGPRPRRLGRRLGVVAVSGGACDLIADRASDEGFELPPFPAATQAALGERLPSFAALRNPLDVTGYVVVDPTLSLRALEVVAADAPGTFDTLLFQLSLPRVAPADPGPLVARLAQVAALQAGSAVPVVLQASGGGDLGGFAGELAARFDLHLLDGIEHGMGALGRAMRWQERRERRLDRPPPPPVDPLAPPPGARGVWGELAARGLLADHGIPLVPAETARDPEEALAAADRLGWPVVLKLVAPGLAHRSDLGGVALDLRRPEELRAAALRLLELAARQGVEGAGLLVSPLKRGGVELLAAVQRDPRLGSFLVLGAGGTLVELLADRALLPLPAQPDDVADALTGLRIGRLLAGARGRPPVDQQALLAAIGALARLGQALGDALDTVELNPLLATPEGAWALDALVVWATPAAEADPSPSR